MEERRKTERFQMLLPARWETSFGVHSGVVLNGSVDGCFVQTHTEDPGDDPLRLEIRLPDGKCLNLWGEVTYYLPTEGFGFHFIGSPDDGGHRDEMWLEHLSFLKKASTSQYEGRLVTA